MDGQLNKPEKPNDLLRRERKRRGLSQERLAELIGADPSMISRWERGARGTDLFYQEKLCELFRKDALELGFVEPVTSLDVTLTTESADEVNRREAGKKIASILVGGSAFLATPQNMLNRPLWERLSRVIERSSRIDEVGLNGLTQIARDYWKLRTTIGYRSLLHGFTGHLETVVHLLQCSQSPASRKRLCAIASEITQRIGAIYFDMNDYASAREYYNVSIETAREAEDSMLWAIGLVRMSSLPIYSKRPQDALPLLQAARQLAGANGTPTILAWMASMEAEACANLHDEHASLKVLGQAERLTDHSRVEEDPHEIKFDHARFAGYKGVCYLRLQQPEAALIALNEGTNLTYGALSVRQQSILLADSAAAHNQLGEIEEACGLATQALMMTDQTKSLLVTQRLLDFRQSIKKQWESSQPVKEFDTQLVLRGVLPA